jgi:hypothetical protein
MKTDATIIVDVYNTCMKVSVGDRLKLRGISYPMEVVQIDSFCKQSDLLHMRRVQGDILEGGTAFKIHNTDVAVEGRA